MFCLPDFINLQQSKPQMQLMHNEHLSLNNNIILIYTGIHKRALIDDLVATINNLQTTECSEQFNITNCTVYWKKKKAKTMLGDSCDEKEENRTSN